MKLTTISIDGKPNNNNNFCRVFCRVSRLEGKAVSLCVFPILKGRGCHYYSSLKAVTLLCNLLWWEGSQTIDNEGLLASETKRAKQNTKHSSKKAVITDETVYFPKEYFGAWTTFLSLWHMPVKLRHISYLLKNNKSMHRKYCCHSSKMKIVGFTHVSICTQIYRLFNSFLQCLVLLFPLLFCATWIYNLSIKAFTIFQFLHI